MAWQTLGEAIIAIADTEQTLYEAPADTEATGQLVVVNQTSDTDITLRWWHTDGSAAANQYLRGYDYVLPANSEGPVAVPGVFYMAAGDKIIVRCSSTSVTVALEGIERSTSGAEPTT